MGEAGQKILDSFVEFLRENGYPGAIALADVVTVVPCNLGQKILFHLDENYLAIEQPHEMWSSARRPKDHFELWVDLNNPDSLDQLLGYLSRLNCLEGSSRNSSTVKW